MTDIATDLKMNGFKSESDETNGLFRRTQSFEVPPSSMNDEEKEGSERKMSAYERLTYDLASDQRYIKEITLGKRIGFYRIRGELGSGNFSQVKMGIHALTKEKVAIKILDKTKLDDKTQRLLSREISCMENLHHPNIIRLYEVIETLAKLHIVMEYAGGGELFNKLSNEGKFSEPEAKIIFSQIVAAVDHMHCQNIIHRDMKAENVFYAGPRLVKIGDFGFSISTRRDNPLNTFCGSPPYAAPELFKDESYIGIYVDVWALGILLFFMVTGIMPFRADTVAKLKKCILDGNYTIPSYVSDSCQFLIRSILKPVPQDRFGIDEIKASEWLEGQEFPEALEPYNVNPSPVGADLSEEERLARKTLCDLGITEDHIQNVCDQNSHSNITGTYRIVLHKVQKRRLGITDVPMIERALTDVNRNQSKPKNSTGSKQSKFCVIL